MQDGGSSGGPTLGEAGHGQTPRPAWSSDLCREIEAMRHVIVQENSRLREQICGLKDECARLHERLGSRLQACGPVLGSMPSMSSGSASLASRWLEPLPNSNDCTHVDVPCRRRAVEWCIKRIDGPRAAELGERVRSSFTLQEYPGVEFRFTFGADCDPGHAQEREPSSKAVSAGRFAKLCHLKLRVSGSGAADICLRVALEAEDVTEVGEGDSSARGPRGLNGGDGDGGGSSSSEGGSDAGSSNAGALLGRLESELLCGGGQAMCSCTWPATSNATVVCRAHIEFAGQHPGALPESLRLVSTCSAAQGLTSAPAAPAVPVSVTAGGYPASIVRNLAMSVGQ